jgi:hypothetical protein
MLGLFCSACIYSTCLCKTHMHERLSHHDRNKIVNVYKIKHIYIVLVFPIKSEFKPWKNILYTTYIDKHGDPMLVGPRANFCPPPCAYIVHVYAKRTCMNAYLTMTRPKGTKVLSSHCVQRGLLIFNINIGGM